MRETLASSKPCKPGKSGAAAIHTKTNGSAQSVSRFCPPSLNPCDGEWFFAHQFSDAHCAVTFLPNFGAWYQWAGMSGCLHFARSYCAFLNWSFFDGRILSGLFACGFTLLE
jgi:hypothetical protein